MRTCSLSWTTLTQSMTRLLFPKIDAGPKDCEAFALTQGEIDRVVTLDIASEVSIVKAKEAT